MWLRTWGPWLLGVAAAVAALTQKLCPQARVVFWATVTVAAVSIASSALAFWSGRIAAKAKAHDDALRALHEALVRLVAKLNVPFDDLGLHVYRRRRTLRCQLGYEHVRIVRLRLDSSIAPSGVIWKEGKGLLGQLAKNFTAPIYWSRELYEPYRDCTVAEWDALPAELRIELSHADWQAAKRHAGVVAVPIVFFRSGKPARYLGCVTLDCSEPATFAKFLEPTAKKFIEKQLTQAGNTAGVAIGAIK